MLLHVKFCFYSKTCPKRPLKKNNKIGFQYRLSLNAGKKCCRMLPSEHSAILSTFIIAPFSIKTFVLSIFMWPLKTDLTVFQLNTCHNDLNYMLMDKQ